MNDNSQTITPEEMKQFEESKKNGSRDIRMVMIDYAKRFNGYPYISASRIEREPAKGEKASVLFEQLMMTYLIKNAKNPQAMKDFMEVFGNGRLIFFQAHQKCPRLGPDGLYDSRDGNGDYVKTNNSIGYYAMTEMEAEETNDEVALEGWDYFYRDQNEQLMNIFVNVDVPLKEYYKIHGKLLKRKTRPDFTPLIVVKQAPDKFGMIVGDPYHTVTAPEVVAALKKQAENEAAAE